MCCCVHHEGDMVSCWPGAPQSMALPPSPTHPHSRWTATLKRRCHMKRQGHSPAIPLIFPPPALSSVPSHPISCSNDICCHPHSPAACPLICATPSPLSFNFACCPPSPSFASCLGRR